MTTTAETLVGVHARYRLDPARPSCLAKAITLIPVCAALLCAKKQGLNDDAYIDAAKHNPIPWLDHD